MSFEIRHFSEALERNNCIFLLYCVFFNIFKNFKNFEIPSFRRYFVSRCTRHDRPSSKSRLSLEDNGSTIMDSR